MTGNTFGNIFKITTFGESHGKAIGVVIDGCPPNIEISEEDIQKDLDRRRPSQNKLTSSRNEKDKAEILSGVFEGRTTGHPICILIWNNDAKSDDYDEIKDIFRPSHADFTYFEKYQIRDHRGGGRSSGRETAGRVAAGAIAKKIIPDIKITAYSLQIGNIKAKNFDYDEIENNPVKCPDPNIAKKMEELIEKAQNEGNSIGGIIEIIVKNMPSGLGDPVFDKLEADLGKALLSIGGVRGIEFGRGFECAKIKGSEFNDEFFIKDAQIHTKTNNSGGIQGGISNGEDIIIRLAVKPTSSISMEQKTVTVSGEEKTIKIKGRHDPCLCPRIIPVAEAMTAIVIADKFLIQNAYKITEISCHPELVSGSKIEEETAKLLIEKKLTISVAESCTGGLISSMLVNYPGISEVFKEACVTYSNESKIKRLGVSEKTLKNFGAVSKETAIEMAKGIALSSGSNIGISTTGIAGPTGGTFEKPVGLVYIGLYIKGREIAKKINAGTERNQIRQISAEFALNFLKEELL